jgi:hypothetical protein
MMIREGVASDAAEDTRRRGVGRVLMDEVSSLAT